LKRTTSLALIAFLLAPIPAVGQQRVGTFAHQSAQRALPAPYLSIQQGASNARLIAFGLLGGAAGMVVGGLAGAVIGANDDDDPDSEWVNALRGSVIGGSIGESISLAAGVHLANGRRGNFLLGTLASLAIGAAGTALVIENQDPPAAPIILTATPIAQLIATILIERKGR
jgi:hypothetical protein